MESDVVIKVENVYKKFCRSLRRSAAYGTYDLFRNLLGLPVYNGRLRRGEFWALDNINFELKKGDSLGIIGLNGSGKSTLLRMITGIFPPDRGKISVKGRVGSLIAVGAGFHPHMTGRENIYLNGAILGMTKEEIDKKFSDIIDFAEIGDFIDAPVSTYSSGMYVRLGFAIAIHCETQVLLIDEILSVGDISFRNKSLRRMAEFREKANALIFVSHNIEQVRTLCNKVIVLEKGKVIYNGETNKGISVYEESTRTIRTENLEKEIEKTVQGKTVGTSIKGSDDIQILNTEIVNSNNQTVKKVDEQEPLIIKVDFKVQSKISGLYFSVSVHGDEPDKRNCIWVMSNDNNKAVFDNIEPGSYSLNVVIEKHHLAPGVYYATAAIRNDFTTETYEKFKSNISFSINSSKGNFERGVVNVSEEWKLQKI